MELCDGIILFDVPIQPLGQTILDAFDPPAKIGFCFSKPCTACQYPLIPCIKYFVPGDVRFIVALLRNEFITSMYVRRWDLIERVFLYIGYESMNMFNTHRANVFSPLDRLYSYLCLFPVVVSMPKLSQHECDALVQFTRPLDGITKPQLFRFMCKNAESNVYYNETPKKNDLSFVPNNIMSFLEPNKVVIAGGSMTQLKTPWANVLPSSDIDVFVLNSDKIKAMAIVSSFDIMEYFACRSSSSVVTLIPKIVGKKVVQIILHEITSTKGLLETFDIYSLKIAFDSQYFVYPFVAISDWEERTITSCNCIIEPRRFLKMYLKGYNVSQNAKEYMGKMLDKHGMWPIDEEVITYVRDMVYMANPYLSTLSNMTLFRALGFTFDIGNITPMVSTMNMSYMSSSSMGVILWEAFTRDRSIMNFTCEGPTYMNMITSDRLMQMPLVILSESAIDIREQKLQILKDEDIIHYALLQAVIRNGLDTNVSIDECIIEYMRLPFKNISFITCPDSMLIQDGIPQKRLVFSGKMQIVAHLHTVSCSTVVWKIHTLMS